MPGPYSSVFPQLETAVGNMNTIQEDTQSAFMSKLETFELGNLMKGNLRPCKFNHILNPVNVVTALAVMKYDVNCYIGT